ncbi:MAG TPA: hypothetical protein VFZ62_03935 [Candidatus Saccharimonadales bacterium]
MSQKTITINGTTYDAHTGLPVEGDARVTSPSSSFDKPKSHHSHDIHSRTQKSHTLNRRVVKKIASQTQTQPQTATAPHKPVQKSPAITKFAPHPTGNIKRGRVMSDIGPTAHPMVQKAHQQMSQKAPQKQSVVAPAPHMRSQHQPAKAAPKPSHVIKQEAVAKALNEAPSHQKNAHKEHKVKGGRKTSRILSIASASLALLLLGGYFTYLNMPNLSVRVAAAQAGIDASYPSYRPDGYSLNGPVAYDQGEVSMKFAANAGPQNFAITQTKTDWDSSALKENYVKTKWGENATQYTENGLTIYALDGDAAWVNNGILYTIDGDAPLSSSQIRGIATSM